MKIRNLIYISIFIFFISCGSGVRKTTSVEGDTLYMPRYASGFAIRSAGGASSVLTVTNPWQGADGVSVDLFIARNGENPPAGWNGATVAAPLRKVVCMSSSYVGFIDELGEIGTVRAVSGAGFITNDHIREGYASGAVKDVGYDTNVNFELVASLQPDLVLIYGVAGDNQSMTRRFDELGIQWFYVGEYLEQSPLGKAEWLVAIGELYDKREEAEVRFGQIESAYNDLKDLVAEEVSAVKPKVMLNAPWRDTWFVPGDRNYMVRLIDDAGGDYACKGDDSEISRPISTEAAFIYALDADVWLNPGQVNTLAEVKSLNPRFSRIPAVVTGRIYNATLRSTPDGGSDFWESGAVRADIVLKDMVEIMHPGLVPDPELFYFRRME